MPLYHLFQRVTLLSLTDFVLLFIYFLTFRAHDWIKISSQHCLSFFATELDPLFSLSFHSWRIDWSGSSGFCKATLYHSRLGPGSFHYLNEGWEMFLPAPEEKGGPPFRASFEDCGVKCCSRELPRLVRLNLGQVEPVALKIIALIVTIHILEGQPRSIPVVSVVNPKCGSGLVSTL